MKQKIFLTSALAMGFVVPAFAAPSHTGEFPTGGLMQEDYTYTNAATEANMGVYEGTVNATAEYTDDLYTIVAGNYLKAGSEDENGTQCTQGNFCPGLTNALYNESEDQGLNSCSTATNGIYTLSAAGASSQNDCYRQCTTADVAHSKGTMNGGYYYGDNNQCEPTDCVNGWHLKQGLNLTSTIGNVAGTDDLGWVNNSGQFHYNGETSGVVRDTAFFGLDTNNHNTWAVYYANDKGMLTGQARCSTQAGDNNGYTWTNPTITANLADETGQEGAQYCYCNVTGYTPNGGTMQAVFSPWVFSDTRGAAGGCTSGCAGYCVSIMSGTGSFNLAFRAAMLGAVQPGLAMCEANTITINWSNADAEDVSANNAGTATYDSDIRTPVKAQTIKGKTFKGWRFSKPETTNLP